MTFPRPFSFPLVFLSLANPDQSATIQTKLKKLFHSVKNTSCKIPIQQETKDLFLTSPSNDKMHLSKKVVFYPLKNLGYKYVLLLISELFLSENNFVKPKAY